ncbi:MAG: hypothetical protein JJ920_08800 [Roseitalea sp.]|nr:hypothetical protein [Roseitalea sp.]MBO6722461.1 hypothetical protein [Roseitalea sp.]MBO6742996.1 hypothetical protein [Roseitalea sp.]
MSSTNFFVDFTLFNVLGYLGGVDWMVAFSVATFLALITRHLHSRAMHRPASVQASRDKPDFSALPAFRDDADRRKHERRRR